jgi:DNA-binding MarR family transcriptional regulator
MPQTLTGQDIGQAHYATRAVLDRVLSDAGLGFNQWVALNLLGSNGSPMKTGDLRARLVQGLKITMDAASEATAAVLDRGLVVPAAADDLALTPAGAAVFQEVTAAIAGITERLYGGLPTEDLVIAHRLLTTVTARANAELAT